MSYRSLGSDEVTLRNYRPVGRRKGNMSLNDPLAAGVVVDLHKPGLSGIRIRLPRRRLIFGLYFIKKKVCRNLQIQPPRETAARGRPAAPVPLAVPCSALRTRRRSPGLAIDALAPPAGSAPGKRVTGPKQDVGEGPS
jgi:hypothetical protein